MKLLSRWAGIGGAGLEGSICHTLPRARSLAGALGGRAAGRGALWGAQVVHQRDAVLPTEVNKLDLSDTAVKVDTCKGRGHSKNM